MARDMPLNKTSQSSFPMDIMGSPVVAVKAGDAYCDSLLEMLAAQVDAFPEIEFFELDVQSAPALAAQLNIKALPTLIGWQDGTLQFAKIGLPPVAGLVATLQELAAPKA